MRMARFKVFKRRWWKDARCTVPGPGRKVHVCYAQSEEEARDMCRRFNTRDFGSPLGRGPKGLAYEYQQA